MSANTGSIRKEDYEYVIDGKTYCNNWYIPQSFNSATKDVIKELKRIIKSGELEYAGLHLESKDGWIDVVVKNPDCYKFVADHNDIMGSANKVGYDEFKLLSWIKSQGYKVYFADDGFIIEKR